LQNIESNPFLFLFIFYFFSLKKKKKIPTTATPDAAAAAPRRKPLCGPVAATPNSGVGQWRQLAGMVFCFGFFFF